MANRCTQCGRELNGTDRFCIACGSPVAATPFTGPSAGAGAAPRATEFNFGPPPSAPAVSTANRVATGPAPASAPAPAAYQATPAAYQATPAAYPAAATGFAPSTPSGAPEVALTTGERQLYEVNFAPKLLAPHLLTYLTVTDKRIIVRHPNTLFGFFPLGYVVSSAPHSSVEQVDSGMHVHSGRIMLGTLSLLFALYVVFFEKLSIYGSMQWTNVIMFVVSVVVALACFATAKKVGIIIHTGGSAMFALARGRQQGDVQAAAQVVNRLLLEAEKSRGMHG